MEHVRYPELHVGPAAATRVSCTPIEGAPERPPGAEKVLELTSCEAGRNARGSRRRKRGANDSACEAGEGAREYGVEHQAEAANGAKISVFRPRR